MARESASNERLDIETGSAEPSAALRDGAHSTDTPPDVISDTGVEGGIDAPNEEAEDLEIEPE